MTGRVRHSRDGSLCAYPGRFNTTCTRRRGDTDVKTDGDKNIVCITGSIWTGSRRAPRYMLIKDGFLRPDWFTTYHPITDARFKFISPVQFHMARANDEVLAYMKYGSDYAGIMKTDFYDALTNSSNGVLICGPQEIIAQIADIFPETVIFDLKDNHMEPTDQLEEANRRGQVHRQEINVLQPGAWVKVHNEMLKVLNLQVGAGRA